MLEKLFKFMIFVPFTLIFLPALLIVNTLHKTWAKMLNEVFGL